MLIPLPLLEPVDATVTTPEFGTLTYCDPGCSLRWSNELDSLVVVDSDGLHWAVQLSETGAPASGFEARTRAGEIFAHPSWRFKAA